MRYKLNVIRMWWIYCLVFSVLTSCSSSLSHAKEVLHIQFKTARDLVWVNREPGIRVLDKDGNLIGKRGAQYGEPVEIAKLPRHLIDALVAKEDKRFFEHGGIDLWGLPGLMKDLIVRQRLRGGSTITIQVIKNIFMDREQRSHRFRWKRKFIEWLNAPDTEKSLSKKDILFLYLNRVYFGKGMYGISAASEYYFGKAASKLSLMESAMLIGMLPQPTNLNPQDYPERCNEKAIIVLDCMLDQGKLSKQQYRAALRSKVTIRTPSTAGTIHSQFFVDHVQSIFENFREEYRGKSNLYHGTVTVVTTLDREAQRIAERVLLPQLASNPSAGKPDQGALVAVNSRLGSIISMVGGRDYSQSQFNNATKAQRQAGSTMKPFVFMEALQRGLRPDMLIEIGNIEKIYGKPVRNFDENYPDAVRLDEALINSNNQAAIRLAHNHISEIIDLAKQCGIQTTLHETVLDEKGRLRPNLGLALGTDSVRLIDLVAAYNVIATGGHYVKPYAIREIRDVRSRVVHKHTHNPKLVVSREVAEAMAGLLAEVVYRGTGRNASYGGYAAGKTGTTQDNRDAWFVGFNDELSVGIWVGNQNNTPMARISGGGLPAVTWRNYMVNFRKLKH